MQSRWTLVITHTRWWMLQHVCHSSRLSVVVSAAQPCVSKRDEPPAVREPVARDTNAPEIYLNADGSYKPAGPVGWGDRVTCDEL